MADKATAQTMPFQVRQVGTEGAIKGFFDYAPAEQDAEERNKRAEGMGVAARYRVFALPS